MFHLVVSTHELCMYHSGLVDVFSCGRFETREQAEKKAKEVIKETKYDIQRQMNRAKEGDVNDMYHFDYFVFDLDK